ncbi:unnamed protein product [Mytilus edulis]|uniref:Uncharacterized protein n=1 Tax=Mytilus edulis TaxID=6550 RepID=A0A8S3VFJ6_MYTED|nr:unnamed protein product [Mytilus edulis]
MEEAHQIVQRHVSGQMLRQKKNHDINVSWAKFEPGNMVYVYFPLRTPGLSPKFTNQWCGPYKVIKINSSVTYTVNCGRKGAGQVIHAPLSPTNTKGRLVDEQSPEKTGELESEIQNEDSLPLLDRDDHEDVDNDRPRRFRKPPSWMKDYERGRNKPGDSTGEEANQTSASVWLDQEEAANGSLADSVVPVKVPRTTATAVRSNLLVASSITSPVLFTSPVAQTRVTSSLGDGVFLQPTYGLVVPARRTIETQIPVLIAHHHLRRTVRTWYEEGVKVEETTEETWDD